MVITGRAVIVDRRSRAPHRSASALVNRVGAGGRCAAGHADRQVARRSPVEHQLERGGDTAVRAGDEATTSLRLTNRSRRRFRGTVRDAWPPSAPTDPRAHAVADRCR